MPATTTLGEAAHPAADGPPPVRAASAPFTVRVGRSVLPPHEPLRLYAELAAELGQDQVFLFESLNGPDADCRSAVVGCGRLAEVRVFARHIEIDGTEPLRDALLAVSEQSGMTAPDDARGARHRRDFDRSEQVWELMRRAQRLFAVETDVPADAYAFGFLTTLGYGAAWHMERLPERDAARGGPDATFALFRETVWYDLDGAGASHLRADCADFPDVGAPAVAAAARAAAAPGRAGGPVCPPAPAPRAVRDSVPRDTFLGWVRRCLDHIRVGDIYQIQVGHRIDVETALEPLEVYRRLRYRNPSPYMYLCPGAGGMLIGASPELLFRTEGEQVVMRPIAGTTRRGPVPEENERRVKELLASVKEQAEHIMLVDLCRNDIARVSSPGSLAVEGVMTVEAFSHVFHLVSTVTGRLEPDADVWRTLCATFPAGTMTGAPKLRAMEIIDGLEEQPRGIYAGAVGLIDVRGWSELALCIRTITHDGRTYATQSSAGIVAQSTAEAEWDETLAKMGAAYWALTGEELVP
nr:Lon2 [Streptomyces sp.]